MFALIESALAGDGKRELSTIHLPHNLGVLIGASFSLHALY